MRFGRLVVIKEDVTIVPSENNPYIFFSNDTVTLKATLQQAADGSLGDLDKAILDVTLVRGPDGFTMSCPADTPTTGALRGVKCSNVPQGDYVVQWNIAGGFYRTPLTTSYLMGW